MIKHCSLVIIETYKKYNIFILFSETDSPTVPPDPVLCREKEPPAGGGGPPPSTPNADSTNTSPEHQPADSWEEAAVDVDPLLTPENEEVNCGYLKFRVSFKFDLTNYSIKIQG